MDTTFGCSVAEFLFENNTVVSTSNTHNTIKQQSNNNNNHNNIHNHNNHNNKRFKFKPFHNSLEPFSTTTNNKQQQQQQQQQQSQTIVNPDLIKLNLNNKKDFKKKLLNFDINRNFEDIYWLSLKDKPQQLQQQQQKEIKFDYLSVTTPSTLINQQQQQQQRSSANSSNNNNNNSPNSGDSTYRKQQQPQIPTKLSPTTTTTTTVLVDLNRQSINLPLTPIKEDLFKNRYFENYLLNRKITNNNTNTFHSNSTNHLSTIYFKPSFNLLDQHQSESILTFNESFKLNKLQKLDAIEGSKIFINKTLTTNIVVEQSIEQSTPRKTNNNNNNNIMPNTTPTTTTTTSTPTTILTSTSPSNLIKSNLYKIKEDDIISSLLATTTTPTNDNNTTTKKQEDQLIQTQFRLKPLITSNNNTNKPVNHNLNEEINEHDFDLYDKKLQKNFNKTIIKQDFLNKPITKPQQFSKLINHRNNNNNNNNEEINKNLNENSEFFTAKATSINRSITPTSNNSTTTTTTAAATMNTINSKTKLARIVKTEDESFLNRKTKPYIYNNNNNISKKPTIDENHSSEEETDNQKLKLNNKSTNNNNIQKYNEDYFITRVESPHKLGKSMPDCYMFVGSSSIQVNSNANNLLNQQFQLFQSQMFDNKQ